MRPAWFLLVSVGLGACTAIRPDWEATRLPEDPDATAHFRALSTGRLLDLIDSDLAEFGEDPPTFGDRLGAYLGDRLLDLADIGHLDLSISDGVYVGAHATYIVGPDIGKSRGIHAGWNGRQLGTWEEQVSAQWLRAGGWFGAGPPEIQRRRLVGWVVDSDDYEGLAEETGRPVFGGGGEPWEVGGAVRFLLGVGVDVRPAEAIDFVLGWFGVDLGLGMEPYQRWLASKRAIAELQRRLDVESLRRVQQAAREPWHRLQALDALGHVDDPEVAPLLQSILEATTEATVDRRLAIEGLGRRGGLEHVELVDGYFSLEPPTSPINAYRQALVNASVAFALARLDAEAERVRARLGWTLANFPDLARELGVVLAETGSQSVLSVVFSLPLELRLQVKGGLRDVPRPYLQSLYPAIGAGEQPEGADVAAQALRFAVEVDSSDGSTWLALALVEASRGEGEAAVDALKRGAELGKFIRGTDPRVRFLYGLPEPYRTEARDLILLPQVGDGPSSRTPEEEGEPIPEEGRD